MHMEVSGLVAMQHVVREFFEKGCATVEVSYNKHLQKYLIVGK